MLVYDIPEHDSWGYSGLQGRSKRQVLWRRLGHSTLIEEHVGGATCHLCLVHTLDLIVIAFVPDVVSCADEADVVAIRITASSTNMNDDAVNGEFRRFTINAARGSERRQVEFARKGDVPANFAKESNLHNSSQ